MAHNPFSTQSLLPGLATISKPAAGFVVNSSSSVIVRPCGSPLADLDVYNVIRDIVPPPPVDVTLPDEVITKNCIPSLIPFLEPSSEQLFTRRPSEKLLLQKCRNQLFSASSTHHNLQELLIEIIKERKYSQENDLMELILHAMGKWPNDVSVQKSGLACLVCLNSHNVFCVPTKWAQNIVNILKISEFCSNESILRSSVKLLQNHKILGEIEDKYELVCILLNALCQIPGVDDLIFFTKVLVKCLQMHQKRIIRELKHYIMMLVEFPFRVNERITIPLCWSALEILLILAECDKNWDTLVQIGGVNKLRELSLRPEMKDKCDAILKTTTPSESEDVVCLDSPMSCDSPRENYAAVQNAASNTNTQKMSETCPKTVIKKSPLISSNNAGKTPGFSSISTAVQSKPISETYSKTHSALYAWVLPSGENKSLHKSLQDRLNEKKGSSDIESRGDRQLLPVDALLTRNAPTPPPTQADVSDDMDGEFSDDEFHPEEPTRRNTHMYTPLLPTPCRSPSYSPVAQFYRDGIESESQCSRVRSTSPAAQSYGWTNGAQHHMNQPKPTYNVPDNPVCTGYRASEKRKVRKKKSSRLNFKSQMCIICKEPKAKQVLIVKQLELCYSCLLNPSCTDLMRCLNAHLCNRHSIKSSNIT